MGNLKRATGGAVKTKTKALTPAHSEDEGEPDDGWWRVLLLRGLIQGDLAGSHL